MIKRLLLGIIIIILPFCSACWDLRGINNSAICTGVGIDLAPEGKFVFSGQLVKPIPPGESGGGQSQSIVVSTTGSAVAETARRLLLSLSRIPEWSHASTMILGESLVREDLALIADFLIRNRNIRPNINLMIACNSTPEQVLAVPMPLTTYSGEGLKSLLTVQEKQLGIYVPITVYEFLGKLTTSGIEPAVPQVIIKEQTPAPDTGSEQSDEESSSSQKLQLSGTAVFKDRKMIGSLDITESRGYRWLNARIKQGGIFEIVSPLNPQEYVSLETAAFSTKTKPELKPDSIKMVVSVTAELNFYGQQGDDELLTLPMQKQLEKLATEKIKSEIASCIKQSQDLNSDILGWGLILSQQEPAAWKELAPQWDQIFPAIESDIQVKTQIKRSYLLHKSFYFN